MKMSKEKIKMIHEKIRRWDAQALIEELKKQLATPHEIDSLEVLTSVRDYNELIKIFSNKLGRVMSRF